MTDDVISGHDISSIREFSIESVRQNFRIVGTDNNWNRLLYKESLFIEMINPEVENPLVSFNCLDKIWVHQSLVKTR